MWWPQLLSRGRVLLLTDAILRPCVRTPAGGTWLRHLDSDSWSNWAHSSEKSTTWATPLCAFSGVWVGVCSACAINFPYSRKVEREKIKDRKAWRMRDRSGRRIRNWSHLINLRFAHRVSIWLTSVINPLLRVELSKPPFSCHELSALVKHDSFVAHSVLLITKVSTHARTHVHGQGGLRLCPYDTRAQECYVCLVSRWPKTQFSFYVLFCNCSVYFFICSLYCCYYYHYQFCSCYRCDSGFYYYCCRN